MTTQELSALLETPAAFRAWLEAKEPGEVVGKRRSSTMCPGTKWLAESGAGPVEVLPSWVWGEGKCLSLTPCWLQRFAQRVDLGGEAVLQITAAECLAILDAIGGEG